MSRSDLEQMMRDEMVPAFRAQRDHLDLVDRWWRWDHDSPHAPHQASAEYRQLMDRAQTPWLRLVVSVTSQSLFVEGYRRTGEGDNAPPWEVWQANGMDRRQSPVHRAAIAYGESYTTVLPGSLRSGELMPVIRGVSPRRMVAFYSEDDDTWPLYALQAESTRIDGKPAWRLKVLDDNEVWTYHASPFFDDLTYVTRDEHGVGVCPVVRFTADLDLEGRSPGEVEPLIPLAARVDQTVGDRLIVQRFASWKVRYIAGMAKPDSDEEAQAQKLRLKVEDMLVSEDHETRFGTLDSTGPEGFIAAERNDLQNLAAVAQIPSTSLIGEMANLSAEAIAAANSSHDRKVEELKHSFGESHEQALRLASEIRGDVESADDYQAQVIWRDVDARSFNATADGIHKLIDAGFPLEMMAERLPGWTQQDQSRLEELRAQGGPIEELLRELQQSAVSPEV